MPELCGTCAHWQQRADSDDLLWSDEGRGAESIVREGGDPSPWGVCQLIRHGYGDGKYGSNSDRAFCMDASDYAGWLNTRADFGCVEHQAATQEAQP